jgi:hypothetical protein
MNSPNNDRISKRAYEIWEREGRPQGRHEHHWHAALREIGAEGSDTPGAVPGEQRTGDGPDAEQPHSNADARLSDGPAATVPDTPIAGAAKPKRARKPKS